MIRFEAQGFVGVVTIDRQERRNALNANLCDDIRTVLEAHRDLRAVVITGAGKGFCAGADLARRADDAAGNPGLEHGGIVHGGGDSFRPAFELLVAEIVGFPAPVIAAVHGAALGAGTQLAVACDLRVVGDDAVFGIPAVKLGVVLSAANIARLAALVGQGPARELLLTGRSIDAAEAEAIGLVHRRAADPLNAALEWAQEIATHAPLSVAGHKRALNLVHEASALSPIDRDELAALEKRAFASADLQEGLDAFAARRPPVFEGR